MERLRGPSLLLSLLLLAAMPQYAQDNPQSAQKPSKVIPNVQTETFTPGPPIPADAPRMSKQTRYEIIKDFETQIVYARSAFPMGGKGLMLRNGVSTPNGQELQQALALWGPAVKPGDPAQLSFVQIKDNHIHFDINGGPVRRKKWYQHIEISGNGGNSVPLSPNESQPNPHGTYLDIYFDKYVPEMSAQQLRDLLFPVLDFTARNKEEAYLDTVPPKVKEAIRAHQVLVGMNSEMVLHSRGKPPKKVREKEGEVDYEEWIYGNPPEDVDFVRIVGDEVVRVETMKVGGQKIVRTDKEVILDKPDKDTQAKKDEVRPPNAPSLRRPGEDPDNVPKQDDSLNPTPPVNPPTPPTAPPSGGGPPHEYAIGRR